MSYTIENKPASKNGWQTPAEAKAYYGKYSRDGVTIHWWNTPQLAGTHDQTVNYVLGQAKMGNMSVNYVVSDKKITMLVHPDNVSWHATKGNPTTVGIEFDPRLKAEGYKKAGWLIWQLEKRYNKKLALYPHKHWSSTACPGTIDVNRMRTEANKWAKGDYNPKPVPKPPAKATLVWEKLPKLTMYATNKQPTTLWDFNNTTWNMKPVKTFKKGEQIAIYGKVTNKTLGATYLLTAYSYTGKITNGFNQADMDLYVAPPKPTPNPPTPPVKPEIPPVNPVPPVPPSASDYEKRLSALEGVVKYIQDFLAGIFTSFKK